MPVMLLAAAGSSSTASQVYPGLAGFLVVAGMGVAVYFLFRSMNKQLKEDFPARAWDSGASWRPGGPLSVAGGCDSPAPRDRAGDDRDRQRRGQRQTARRGRDRGLRAQRQAVGSRVKPGTGHQSRSGRRRNPASA